MKQIKKRVLLALCMVACLFSLSACGKAEEEVSGVDPMLAESLQQQTVSLLEQIVTIPADQMPMVIDSNRDAGAEGLAVGLESYVGLADELGAYVSSGAGYVKETDDGYEVSVNAVFQQRECEFVIGLSEEMVEIVSMSFNPEYTMGETMTKAGMNTLLGMGTVFIVLIFISLLISCFKYINVFEQKMKNKGAKEAPAAPAPAPVAAAPVVEENLVDDLELVAVIAAAIAAYEGTSADGLVVRSIRRAPGNKWKRA